MAMPREVGPWGAGGGKPWDDGVFSTIKQVRVHVGELNAIYALQFEYLKKDGKSVFSQIHGGTDGVKNILVVNLDENDEFLTGISGFYGLVKGYNGLEAIRSISFHTNKRIHGPYGEERGSGHVYYSSTASPGKIVGFHGRDIGFLSAIGVHMEYF
ncbi:putative jacalin-like lectin domain-containing protein [Helianthus anomalus]